MKSVVLFSGGQDSTTCLYWAKSQGAVLGAVSVFYGQRHRAELDAAREIAQLAGVPHQLLTCEALGQLADSALVDGSRDLQPAGGLVDEVAGTLPTSYVPARNAILLALAAAYAVKVGADTIITGVCQTDYSGYPDCRALFIVAFEQALRLGLPSSARVEIVAPLMHLTKAATVLLAQSLPGCIEALAKSVTCYEGRRPGCGVCPACGLRAKGFAEVGIADPAAA